MLSIPQSGVNNDIEFRRSALEKRIPNRGETEILYEVIMCVTTSSIYLLISEEFGVGKA